MTNDIKRLQQLSGIKPLHENGAAGMPRFQYSLSELSTNDLRALNGDHFFVWGIDAESEIYAIQRGAKISSRRTGQRQSSNPISSADDLMNAIVRVYGEDAYSALADEGALEQVELDEIENHRQIQPNISIRLLVGPSLSSTIQKFLSAIE